MPSKNPRFHRNEIDEGDGRSIRDLFIILVRGTSFTIWVFIRRMRLGLG